MANDLATLRARLATSLRDSGMTVWASAELDDILKSAAAQLYPRVAIPMSAPIYPLTAEEEDYAVPLGIMEVSRVDLADVANDTLIMPLPPGTWEIYGDVWSLTGATLFINRSYSTPGHYYIVHGYGTYNLSTKPPPDMLVPFILATAQAEAIRTMVPKRASFEKWMALNQKENVSVNELTQMLGQAEAAAERHRSRMKTWRKPKPAR